MGSVPGSGAAVWLSVWVSARSDLEKVPAFFDFAGTFLRAISIETHGGSFYRVNYYLYSGHSVLCLDPVSFWQYPGMDIYFVPFGTFLVIFLD